MQVVEYLGLECVEVVFGDFRLIVAKSVGPRILSFRYRNNENMLAELPGEKIANSAFGGFYFYGGHRLWVSPEVPEVTYLPDNEPVQIANHDQEIQLTQPLEFSGGWVKSIHIKPALENRAIIVDHFILNSGQEELEIAPWAITQFRTGGTAILPQPAEQADAYGLQPNRLLVLWPYTRMNDPRIHWGDRFLLVDADRTKEPLKIGILNKEGWLAYQLGSLCFIKFADHYPSNSTPDFNATSQCYTNSKFLELETLGPKSKLKPGENICHREIWTAFEIPEMALSEQSITDFIKDKEILGFCRELIRKDED